MQDLNLFRFPFFMIFIIMKRSYTKEILEPIVMECGSYRQVLTKLGLKEAGSNYENIKTRIKNLGIDTSHFHGKKWNHGKKWSKLKDVSFMLVENSTYSSGLPRSSYKVKTQLLKHGLKKYECESCHLSEWMGVKIPLELHHINGNKFDNRIENLQILCPNCHALTPNYRSKNLSALGEIREVEFRKFGEGLTANTEPSLSDKDGVETRHGTPKS
jgi:hypothetical protein